MKAEEMRTHEMRTHEMRTHEMRTQETQTQETQTRGMQTEGMKNEKKHRGLWKGRSLVVLATLGVCSMLGACKIISIEQAGGIGDTREIGKTGGTGDTREIGKTGGTGDTGEIGGTGDTVEISQTGESEILLVERDENYAWGFVSDGGCFVDTNGRLYPYSNGIEHLYDDERGQDFSYLDYLEIIRENYKEEVYIDLKYVDQIKKLGKDLSPDDEFEEIHKMCDYGQDTIYYFDPELRQFLKCKSTGDKDMIPKNKSAEKIADLFWNDIDANLPQTGIFQTVPSLYRPKWCFMTEIEVSDQNEWTGKWILKDRDMLQAFAEQSGIDVTEILTTMEETDINNTAFENYDFKANKVFFVEVKSASDTKEMGSPKVFWICGNCCDYLYDEEKKEESQSPVCLVSAVETWDMPEDLTTLVDFDGNAWKVFEGVSNSIEKPLTETEEQIVEGAYVNSFSCGYLSGDLVPDQYTMYLVTNEEELAYAECYLGMQIPLNVDDFFGFNIGLAEEFQKMKEAYPISDYNYLLYYSEYSQGGHYHHSDSVVFNEDRIYFHYDEVRSPEGEIGTDVMEGDFDMAAVPKAFFEGKNFKNTKRYGILLTEEGTADNEVEEGWCAKFEYGNPDFVNETFVYFTEDGYKCVNAHNAYILGTSKWERWMDYYELVSTKEEVLEAAKKHGSNGDLFYQGDDKMYEPGDFLDKVDVSEMQEPASKVSQQDANTPDTSTDKAIKVVWSNIYYWAMGSDYVYIDSDGYIYAEYEMEEPLFSPFGACDETYTGKKFTEEEFNAFLELKYDEVAQKEVLSKKGIKFGE